MKEEDKKMVENSAYEGFSVNHAYFCGTFYLKNAQQIENYSQSIKATVPLKKHKQIYKKSINATDLEQLLEPEFLKNMDIVDICCGSNSYTALTGDGYVFTNGPEELNFTCLGRENKTDKSNKLTIKGANICASGPFHTLVGTDENKIYSWGYNINCSTLGINGNEVRKNASSGNYARVGQLGRENQKNAAVLGEVPVKLDGDIVGLACGASFSVALTNKGTLYTWGLNDENCLAREENPQTPLPVSSSFFNNKILKVACGSHHVLAKTEGTVYGWGWNSHSQTGIPQTGNQMVVTKPTIIEKLSYRRVRDISAGNCHSVASTASGRIITWGSNDFGELGRNNSDNLPHSVKLKNRALNCVCGESTSAAVCEDGSVWTWGRLAGEEFAENAYAPRRLKNNYFVTKAEVGSTHWVFMVNDVLTKALQFYSENFYTVTDFPKEIYQHIDPVNLRIIQERVLKEAFSENNKLPMIELDKGFLSFGWQTSTASQVINVSNPTSKTLHITVNIPKDLPHSYSIYCPPEIEIKAKTKVPVPFTLNRKAPRPPEIKDDFIRLISIVSYQGKKPSLGKKMKSLKFYFQFSISENPSEVGKFRPRNKLESTSLVSQATDLSSDLSDDEDK
eukprot:TRINITY_DN3789_c1_g1_i1.p1 TRINITY_DN3789_c1_g1~~TRINITY_DN3789_c1_g1_i1.p1  ORF type:complete len:621 (-),score=140.15 TRINITY_DN3789_c1_g1_i1:302-2164(-)